MELLDIELACRVYKQLGDAGMVMALQDMEHIEDKDLLAGHVSLLFCDYMRARSSSLSPAGPPRPWTCARISCNGTRL